MGDQWVAGIIHNPGAKHGKFSINACKRQGNVSTEFLAAVAACLRIHEGIFMIVLWIVFLVVVIVTVGSMTLKWSAAIMKDDSCTLQRAVGTVIFVLIATFIVGLFLNDFPLLYTVCCFLVNTAVIANMLYMNIGRAFLVNLLWSIINFSFFMVIFSIVRLFY